VSLKPVEPIAELITETLDKNNFFLKIHVPLTHNLNRTNYSLTLEDLSQRLKRMKINFPLCVYSSGNNPAARLNYQLAMDESIDGRDYVMFVFVNKSELQNYKRRWPNQILVELPFQNEQENWKDVHRQVIKIFGETLETEYVFMLEDNVYSIYKEQEGQFAPVSLLEYFQVLQAAAVESKAPLLGARVVGIGAITAEIKQKEWENGLVHTAFAVRTQGLDVYFENITAEKSEDPGLNQFNAACNEVGVVQQNQKYVIQGGYTIDPIGEYVRDTEFTTVDKLEPESHGHNLKVKFIEMNFVIDQVLADGTKYARGLGLVADSTGSVVIIAQEDQVSLLVPGNNYSIRNAKIVMFKGFMRVEVDEWGKIQPIKEEINPKISKNVSLIEYELVQDLDDGDNNKGDDN